MSTVTTRTARSATDQFSAGRRRMAIRTMDEIRRRHKGKRGAKSAAAIIRAFRENA